MQVHPSALATQYSHVLLLKTTVSVEETNLIDHLANSLADCVIPLDDRTYRVGSK